MGICKFIPVNNESWVVNNDTIYFRKYGLIPVLKKIDGIYFVSLDRRVTKQVIKMIQKLEESNQEFLLCDRLSISEKHIYREDLPRIINNYLMAIGDDVFFKFITKTEFDYINNLTNFLEKFKGYEIFKNRYDYLKENHFHKTWMDWYTRKEYWNVKNEEIRDYFSIFERQVKLNIFFS